MASRGPRREIRESCLTLSGEGLACTLRRSARRRTLVLRVGEGGEVVVNAPLGMPEGAILGFLGKHLEWIRARQQDIQRQAVRWEAGACLPYLGGQVVLSPVTEPGRVQVRLDGEAGALLCAAPPDRLPQAVLAWYQRTARPLLAERLAFHCRRLDRPVPPLRLSNARTRWGSLSPKGVVSLNWRLIKAGWEEIDYVICHELAHFRHRNHSAAFWREVETLYPAWETARRRLRENGRRYFAF